MHILEDKVSLMEALDRDMRLLEKRVGKDRSVNTFKNMQRVRGYISGFLERHYQCADIALEDLSENFIYEFSAYLSVERNLHNGTIWLACMQLKGVVTRAYNRGELTRNPFYKFHIKKNTRPRQFLTEEEIGRLMAVELPREALAFARDVFVFCCFTGLSFIDVKELRPTDIVNIEGGLWIISQRHKTKVPYQVKLLPVAIEIISRYRSLSQSGYVFGQLQYRTLTKQVKRVVEIAGIQKNIGLHCARHTFAVLALTKGMPIESVSRILGHTNITTTQIYAKITMRKLNDDFETLKSKLSMENKS